LHKVAWPDLVQELQLSYRGLGNDS
jgi:hypothetical protein